MANKYRWPDGKLHSISYNAHKDHVRARNKRKGDGDDDLATRVKHDPKLLERALRDPGLRSKLPDKYLSKSQRAARRENEFRHDIGDIDDPLTGDSLVNAAQRITAKDYDPLEAAITNQEGAARRQTAEEGRRAGAYYGGLNASLAAALGAQGAENAAAVQAAQARAAGTQGAIDAASQQAQGRAAQDAKVRGAAVQGDAIEQMAAQAAQQKAAAAAAGQTQTGAAQQFGDAQAAFLRGIQGSTAQAGGEQQAEIGRRGAGALSDLANERSKLRDERKGAFTDTLLKLRSDEADRNLTRRSLANDAEKAILDYKADVAQMKSKAQIERANRALKLRLTEMGLDQKTAQAEADRASREAVAEANNATSRANNRDTNQTSHDNNVRTNRNRDRDRGGFTHKDRVTAAGKRDDAINKAMDIKRRRVSRADALALLSEDFGSDFARVAVGAIYDGGAKPHLDALLAQRYGIHIPRKYRTR